VFAYFSLEPPLRGLLAPTHRCGFQNRAVVYLVEYLVSRTATADKAQLSSSTPTMPGPPRPQTESRLRIGARLSSAQSKTFNLPIVARPRYPNDRNFPRCTPSPSHPARLRAKPSTASSCPGWVDPAFRTPPSALKASAAH
jgi:hypothetical protein